MIKKILIVILILFTVLSIIYSKKGEIVIKSRYNLKTEIDLAGQGKLLYIEPPVNILEGINGEIIVFHDTFFEVFDKYGKRVKKIGAKGQGPKDFNNIMSVIKYDEKYFFHDWINTLSVYNKDFKFLRKFYLGGGKTSKFFHTFTIVNNNIYVVQNYYNKYRADNCHVITVYDMQGKIINHFFDRENGLKIYSEPNLVYGRMCSLRDKLIFSFFSIPQVWILDINGNIINNTKFGNGWWRKIIYNKKKYNNDLKRGFNFATRNLLLSGNRIMKLYSWKDKILLHICIDPAEEYIKHGIVVFNANLKLICDFKYLKGYQFSGVGAEYLYFSKTIKEDRKTKNVEVLKCDLKL